MSVWAHVNGSIRVNSHVDANRFKTFTYYSSYEDKKACNVPRGKEESLQVQVYNYPDDNDARSVLNFFGDLRGFDDHQEIIDWVVKVILQFDLRVLNGIINIDDKVYVYMEDISYEDEYYTISNQRFECIYKYSYISQGGK